MLTQRTGTIKRVEQRKPLRAGLCRHQRREQEQGREQHERDRAVPARYRKAEMARRHSPIAAAQPEPGYGPKRDGADLPKRSADENHDRNGRKRDGRPRSIRRQTVGHAPDRLRDHGDRDQLQAVQNPFGEGAGEGGRTEREGEENDCRRHSEGEPRRKPAEQAVAAQDAEREADLAGSRPWQELAERDDIGVAAFAEPFLPFDEFRPEVAEMRDRPAERCQSQLEEGGENLGHGARGLFRHAMQLQCRLKIPGTDNVTKRLGRPLAKK